MNTNRSLLTCVAVMRSVGRAMLEMADKLEPLPPLPAQAWHRREDVRAAVVHMRATLDLVEEVWEEAGLLK